MKGMTFYELCKIHIYAARRIVLAKDGTLNRRRGTICRSLQGEKPVKCLPCERLEMV